MKEITVIIPVKNEAANLADLCSRLTACLIDNQYQFSLIFVDDHSTDETKTILKELESKLPLKYLLKKGKPGKGYSIIEGCEVAGTEFIAFIDGDLQYAPEDLIPMLKIAPDHGVVVGNRRKYNAPLIRKIGSRLNTFIFGRLVLGLKCDVQSGIKVFRREIFDNVQKEMIGPWTVDMPILFTAKELGYSIGTTDIEFEVRKKGISKVGFLRTALAIASCALNLRVRGKRIYQFSGSGNQSMVGSGVVYHKRKFVTHSTLPYTDSALETFKPLQKMWIGFFGLILAAGLVANFLNTLITLIGILSFIYFLDFIFSSLIVIKSLKNDEELSINEYEINSLNDSELPTYSILCPLYKEARVIESFVKSMEDLDWPKERLEVLLLLEEDDRETLTALEGLSLPEFVIPVKVPFSLPRTKPKACNYGLNMAKGEYVVIYDAEDRPDRDQLKKAYIAFQKLSDSTACVQAKLNYYNPEQNLLTRLFTAEYSLWFDLMLPGLQTLNTAIPLGGTSNHFKTEILKKLRGWDAFNVTEDCDIGMRLFRNGFRTAIIDSLTLEEANSNIKNWIRQRSRWIKGYMQTFLVHSGGVIRNAPRYKLHSFVFLLVVGARMYFMLLNPVLWVATAAYFILHSQVGSFIESLYPSTVYYAAASSLVFGNFIALYNYMIGCAKRNHWSLIKYVFLIPFYWILTSFAAAISFYQLLFKPHFWEKTHHGLHLKEPIVVQPKTRMVPSFPRLPQGAFSGLVLVASSTAANFGNLLFNAFLGRKLSLEDFGLVSLIASVVSLMSIPLAALYTTVSHKVSYFAGKYGVVSAKLFSVFRRKSLLVSIVFAILWILSVPMLTSILKVASPWPLLVLAVIPVAGAWAVVNEGFLDGSFKFGSVGFLLVIESAAKLGVSFAVVALGFSALAYISFPISAVITVLVGSMIIAFKGPKEKISDFPEMRFPTSFFSSALLLKATAVIFLSLDVLIAKYYLSPSEAGLYALVSLTGKLIFFIGTLFTQFITPLVSRENGEGKDGVEVFRKIFALTFVASSLAFFAVGPLGGFFAPLLFGNKVLPVISHISILGLGILCFTLSNCLVTYYQTRNNYIYPLIGSTLCFVQIFTVGLFERSVSGVANGVAIAGAIHLSVILGIHFLSEVIWAAVKNWVDILWVLCLPEPHVLENSKKLRILIFNWRDTMHRWSGGAEVYLHELARRLSAEGHYVTLFCGNDGHSKRLDEIDRVRIIRLGGFFTVYLWACVYYILKMRNRFDVIVDSENGIPFFTPLYAKEKKFLLIYHVHQEVFRKSLLPPFCWLATFLEMKLMPLVYKNADVITISKSSLTEIVTQKITKREPDIVFSGVDLSKFKQGVKSDVPQVLYLGRLKHYKSVDTMLKAAALLKERIPEIKFIVAGDGEEFDDLIKLRNKLGLQGVVEFHGKVTEEEKIRLYQSSWVFVNPSFLEGWGITTIEANACGTPVVASNVNGLKDSVQNPHTGFLVPWGNEKAFADKIELILNDSKLRKNLEIHSLRWAKKYSWEKSARKFRDLLFEKKGKGVEYA